MQTLLFIPTHRRNVCLNIDNTIPAFTTYIKKKLPSSWARTIARIQQRTVFSINTPHCIPSAIIRTSLNSRNLWLASNGPSTLVDLHTPLMGEDPEDMIFSDNENNPNGRDDNTDTDTDSDNDYIM